jgi:2-oxoglutarate dehydrogenase complex dehydrogenase (E1) component-like enzyme
LQWAVLLRLEECKIITQKRRNYVITQDIAIVRIEELSPFPFNQIKKTLSVYGSNVELFWVQEDHENFGAWNYIRPRLNKAIGKTVGYYGRKGSASTAVGFMKKHKKQEKTVLDRAFGPPQASQ